MRGPAGMALVDYQGVAVPAMPLQMGVIKRQVVVGVLDLDRIVCGPELQCNKHSNASRKIST